MTEHEIIEFYKLYKPDISRIYDNEKQEYSSKWHLFTLATQHCNIEFNSYEEAFKYAYDFVKDGQWKPDETWLNRYLQSVEKEEIVPFDLPPISDEEFKVYMNKFVNAFKNLMTNMKDYNKTTLL